MKRLSLQSRLNMIRDALRTQLWPVPLLGIVVGLALSIAVPRADRRIDDNLSLTSAWLFGGSPSAARTLLGAIAGSMITVTALTFSLTVLTLQLASSQYSPRLLRTFTRDRFVHLTLALFLATFTYSLALLRTVRDESVRQALFVPQLAITLAFVFAVMSVVGLVLFLAHLAEEIRIEAMLRNVHRDATETVRRILEPRPAADETVAPTPPEDALTIVAATSGFVIQIDEQEVLAAAVEGGAMVLLDCHAGSSLVADTPIGVGWPLVGATELDRDTERLGTAVAGAVSTGFERTEANDPSYGLRQLSDVASKALSPGINDPTTAIHALGHCSALLSELAGRDLGPRLLRDEDDRVRVVLRRPGFTGLLEIAIGPTRRYGASDPLVLGRIFTLLAELAWIVQRPDQHRAIALQLERLRATAAQQNFDPAEHQALATLARGVEQAQHGRWAFGPTAA